MSFTYGTSFKDRCTTHQDVVVSDGAIVDGPVYAQNILIEGAGKIYGEVFALNRLNIRSNAVLSGQANVSRISIEDGAFFKGGIEIRKMPWSLPPPPSDEQNT